MRYDSAIDGLRAKHGNNISALRLVFASAVIFSHSAFILTGNQAAEPHFGQETLGGLAVDGFFILSGYLITKSFERDPNIADYLRKRVIRIYPAFVVNMLLCMLVLAPLLVKTYHPGFGWLRIAMLSGPKGVTFDSGVEEQLNASIWTLAYELRCYLVVIAVGLVGFMRMRMAISIAAVAMLIASGYTDHTILSSGWPYLAFGSVGPTLRLFGMFAAGMSFYLWREHARYEARGVAVAMAALLLGTLTPHLQNLTIALFGGYIVFWLAFGMSQWVISRMGDKTDLSYGIYLYAWPVQITVALLLHGNISSIELSFIALAITAGLAYCSWTLVESPAMGVAKRAGVRVPIAVAAE